MNEEINKLIHKGDQSLEAARRLFNDGYYGFSVSRAYYAMFYLAQALLLIKELSFSKHSAVIAALGQHFVRTELFPEQLYQHLRHAFDQRNISDYEIDREVSREEAASLLDKAEAFIKHAERFLNKRASPEDRAP